MGIIICEYGFNKPDPKNPQYSLREVDFYNFIPYDSQKKYGIESHRLSLRKNLATGKFEIYRFFYENEKEETIFTGNLEECLKFAHKEWMKYWGHLGKREPDKVCKHKYPTIDRFFCPKIEGR